MELTKVDNDWIPLQIKVFTRWVSNQLKDQKDVEIKNILTDLTNGVALVDLAQILTHKKALHSWVEHPKRNVDMVQNCDLALEMFVNDGVHLVGISGKDINDSNQKLILGLIWTLILHYSIGKINDKNQSKVNSNNNQIKNAEDSLLTWAKERTAIYPNIHNFTPFDLSICALLDSYYPEKIQYYSLDKNNSTTNLQLAISVMSGLGVPIFVYPDELEKNKNVVDEKTLLTQLSALKTVLDSQDIYKNQTTEKNIEKNISQSYKSQSEESFVKAQNELGSEKNSIQNSQIKIEKERTNSQAEIDRLTNLLQECESQIRTLTEDEKIKEENEIERYSKQKSDNEVKRLSNALKEAESKLSENELLKIQIEKLSKSLDESQLTADSSRWEQTKIENQLVDALHTIKELKEKVDSLSEDKVQMENEIDRLSRSVVEGEAQFTLEKASNNKLLSKVSKLEQEQLLSEKVLKEVQKENKDMINQLSQNKFIISTAAANSIKLERENDLLSKSLADANGKLQEYQTARDITLEELNSLSEGFKTSREENEKLINENESQKIIISFMKNKEIESEKDYQSLTKQLEEEIVSNTVVVKQLGAAITKLHSENDSQKEIINDLNNEIVMKTQEIERLNDVESQLKVAKIQLQKESIGREYAEQKLLELSDVLSAKQHKVDSLSRNLCEAITKLRKTERSRGTAEIEAQTWANALYDAYGEIQTIYDAKSDAEDFEYALENELAKSQNTVEALKQSRIDAEKEIILLENQLTDEKEKCVDIQNHVTDIEEQNEILKIREEQLKKALAVSEVDHEKMRRRVVELENKSQELGNLLVIINQDLETQRSLKAVSQANEEKLAKSLVELQFELQDMKMENETLVSDHKELLTEYDELRSALNDERNLREKVENDAKEFAKVIAQLDRQSRQYKAEKEESEENAEEMARELVKSQVDVVTLQKQNDELQKADNEMVRELVKSQVDNVTLKKDNEELEETENLMAHDIIIADAKLANTKQ